MTPNIMTIDFHVSNLLNVFDHRGNDRLSQIDKCASSQPALNYRSDSIGDFIGPNQHIQRGNNNNNKKNAERNMFHTIISFYCNLSCRFEKFWANAYEVINSLDARMDPFS